MRKGFTLIELAIVLTIVGVILGAAVMGASLIQAARLQTVITDYQKYKTAANEFKTKYGYYPGDMPNAFNYWGGSSNGTGTCTNAVVPSGSATGCNGNGDGQVSWNATTSGAISESSGFWTQLLRANFISTTVNTPQPWIGPKAQIPKGAFVAAFYSPNFTGVEANYLVLVDSNKYDVSNSIGVLSAADAYSIDLKIDDGKPQQNGILGMIVVDDPNDGSGTLPSCIIDKDLPTAKYDLSQKRPLCLLAFRY